MHSSGKVGAKVALKRDPQATVQATFVTKQMSG